MMRALTWFRRFVTTHRAAAVGAVLVGVVILVAMVGPMLTPHNAMDDVFEPNMRPSGTHWLGTDTQGRDITSRLCAGARTTLRIALLATLLSAALGTLIGAVAGYVGGRIDLLLMRVVDFAMSFPAFLLAMVTVALLGKQLNNIVWAVGIVMAPIVARQIRAEVLRISARDYVLAARAVGAGPMRIILMHVLPNCVAPLIVLTTLGMGTAILDVAGLTFLGLGGDVFQPEWGLMLKHAWGEIDRATLQMTAAGLAIFITVLGFNLLGDGLRDELDPKMRGRK